jgi:hypothetical protein
MTFRKTFMMLVAATAMTAPALAADGGADNVEERIRTSVKLKMLSQAVSASACHQQAGIEVDNERSTMPAEMAEFERYLAALIHGDSDLGMSVPESRHKTLHAASLVAESWAPFKAAAETIASGNGQDTDVSQVMEESLHVLENGHNFTAELVQEYANPAEATLADLFTIVLATRQGMLSQKMSKEACQVAYMGGSSEKLGETMNVFENTLLALRDGMPAAGLSSAPTKAIYASLNGAYEQWREVKPVLEKIQAGDTSTELQVTKMKHLDALMSKMLEASALYVDHTKGTHS